MLFSTIFFFVWKYLKVPLLTLVKWEVVSPNSRWTVGIYIQYILYSLILICYLKCGGGVIFFLHFMLFPTFLDKINSGNRKTFFYLMFYSCFLMLDIFSIFKKKKFIFLEILKSAPLLVKCKVVSPNSRYREL